MPIDEIMSAQSMLSIWERGRVNSAQDKSKLNFIIDFLKNEFISEERVLLARTSLGFYSSKKFTF